ncbi:putative linoleate 9S-lipoxygenase 5 [Iris pallida]|uniref:Lipoxygenase n=1 Tax=Iris pallida TaxID=29817 RepID=A0AAX6F316_IRIPA|nr:putative linoleate 9S-lipoxygenase 5 [Iris pallida]
MGEEVMIRGTVVLMKKGDYNPNSLVGATVVQEFQRQAVSFQLVSATVGDNENKGVVGKPAYLEESIPGVEGESVFRLTFAWSEREGIPGAVIVKNSIGQEEFFLKSLSIANFPEKGRLHFVCNSWVYPVDKYTYDRIFFINDTYLPGDTPGPLQAYREEELYHLRGDHVDRQLLEWDRVYNYAFYNDLGDPDADPKLARPVLGGSQEYPYPRRGRTGRPRTQTDPNSESRLSRQDDDVYVPRDERFGHVKQADFQTKLIKAFVQAIIPLLQGINNDWEFDAFEDVLKMYSGTGLVLGEANPAMIRQMKEKVPFESLKDMISITKDGRAILRLPMPHVIQSDVNAWSTDEEFAREIVAGVNPVLICGLKEFPPKNSSITAAYIEGNLDGLTVEQALNSDKLFILDHHDGLMPYLNRINSTTSKVYATRTLLFLRDDGTLKPLAIELSLPPQGEERRAAVSEVFTPSKERMEAPLWQWQLSKAYVDVNDSGVHQLISHWLNTHATMEPFVLATNRHLSTLHPINKLLVPHYRDTMNINALARQSLISAGGVIESTFFPREYSMELSSAVYKAWNFTEQALPVDLLKRGVAVPDPASPNKLRLLIEDYPYAVDGLAIWSAIEDWVDEYCSIYYPTDDTVRSDVELQAWWKEAVEVGHGDKKDEPWWPKMQTVSDLAQSCTILIWVASALHAAVNFGQYPYAGYVPNRPTLSRRFMPQRGTDEYDRLSTEPEKVFLETITNQFATILSVSLIGILSSHVSDEVFLGKRDTPYWTTDQRALDALERFDAKLGKIEQRISEMNEDPTFPNRYGGPVNMPYTLLIRTSPAGVTGRGIPNSVSI